MQKLSGLFFLTLFSSLVYPITILQHCQDRKTEMYSKCVQYAHGFKDIICRRSKECGTYAATIIEPQRPARHLGHAESALAFSMIKREYEVVHGE